MGGGERIILFPYHIEGVENIIAEDNVHIGAGCTIFTTRAKLIIKQHFVSGPNLSIVTGDHMPLLGRFLDTVGDDDKNKMDAKRLCDQDVVIEEDVWCGINVTILKGVTIGRGSIIVAGSVVTKNIPPYSIAAGIPAKPLKTRLTINQIIEHEKKLYAEEKRYTEKQLKTILMSNVNQRSIK